MVVEAGRGGGVDGGGLTEFVEDGLRGDVRLPALEVLDALAESAVWWSPALPPVEVGDALGQLCRWCEPSVFATSANRSTALLAQRGGVEQVGGEEAG